MRSAEREGAVENEERREKPCTPRPSKWLGYAQRKERKGVSPMMRVQDSRMVELKDPSSVSSAQSSTRTGRNRELPFDGDNTNVARLAVSRTIRGIRPQRRTTLEWPQ